MNNEVERDDEYQVLEIPEIDEWRVHKSGYQVAYINGNDWPVPIRCMEHVQINFFHNKEDQEEGPSPDNVWNHKALKPRLQFLYKIELLFGSVKKQVPGDH
jgi:hypothetical protein